MSTVNAIKVFLMGVIAALLLTVVLQDGKQMMQKANAADQATAGGLIALSCPVNNNKSMGVILIDTSTKNMAFYIGDESSKFNMVAARHFGYDLGIKYLKHKGTGYNVMKKSELPKGIDGVDNAKDAYEKFSK